MADEIVDRGDDFVATGDEPGDTGDLKNEGKEPEGKEPEGKEPEGKEPEAKEEKPEPKDDEPRIPKSRFDQAVGKARAAEKAALERAEKLEAELATQKGTLDYDKIEGEIDALEDKLEEAIKDGNVEAKQRLRKEIRTKTAQMGEAKAAAYSQYATAVAVEQIRYDAAVERMEVEHPELNPDLDGFDETKVEEIMDYKSAFEAKGEASTVALKKALKAVYGNAAPKVKEKADDKPEAKKDDEDEDQPQAKDLKEKADKEAADRKAAAVKKGIETKKAQPSNEKAGIDSDKAGKTAKGADINKMSDADFDKLDEAEKKRMRGDDV